MLIGTGMIDINDKTALTNMTLILKGDMSKWIAIANSFKFRTLMVMVDADPSKADDIKKDDG